MAEIQKGTQEAVLVVDDEARTLAVSSDILAIDGYRVSTASDGRDAIKLFMQDRPDAVVSDIRMPGVGGIDLLEMIREIDDDVPVIMLTGYATLETATRAVQKGAFDYLQKPIDFDKLRATLRRALERYRLVKENRRLIRELGAANVRLGAMNAQLHDEVVLRTRELEIERDLLAQVFSTVPTAISLMARGASGRFEVVNANAAWLRLGTSANAVQAAFSADVEGAIAGLSCTVRGRRAVNGTRGDRASERVLDVTVLPIAGGRALFAVDDRTDEVRLEEELTQAEKLSSLGTLAGGIVHDLANPLSAVLGTAQLLEQDLDGKHQDEIGAIISAARYMREVCLGLNEFARRSRPGEVTLVDVSEVCGKALTLARYAKKLSDIEVETRLEPALPSVRAIASELLQVIVNLVVNAADAAPRGRVTVTTRKDGAGESVLIDVKDDGPGVPEALRQQIFEPFYTTKPVGKGTGLGLYIARRIVLRLGGELLLDPGPGPGACFTV
ncbi:MAG: hybrid sensor histidine kinase/response regulator, partial [Polyangiaceae bacterium]